MKQWREIHCDCFLSAEIKRCLSTTHRCKRLPMMHRCRDMLVLDTYCYAPLYQPYIYLQHRTKMITILYFSFFSFICIEYIIYVVFSNQQSTFIFFTLTVNGVSFKQRGKTSGFLSGSYFTHSWVVFDFYSSVLFGISSVRWRVSVCKERKQKKKKKERLFGCDHTDLIDIKTGN